GGGAGVAQHRADRVARDVHRHVGVDHGLVAAEDGAVARGLHGLGVVLVHDRAGVLGGRAGVAADGRDGVARHVHRNVGVGDQLVAAEDRAVARALHGVALGPALVRPLVGLVQHRSGVQPAGLQVQRPGGLAQLVDQPAADRGRLRAALVVALVVAVAAVLVAVVHQGAGVLRGGARAAQHRADRVAGDVHRHVQAEHGLVAADQRAVAGGLDLAAVPVPVVLDDGGAALLGGRAGVAQHRADRVARDVHRHVGVDHGLVAADDRAVPGGLHGLGVVLVHDRAGVLGGRAGVAADGRDGVARHVHRNVGVGDQLVAAEDRAVARTLHGAGVG